MSLLLIPKCIKIFLASFINDVKGLISFIIVTRLIKPLSIRKSFGKYLNYIACTYGKYLNSRACRMLFIERRIFDMDYIRKPDIRYAGFKDNFRVFNSICDQFLDDAIYFKTEFDKYEGTSNFKIEMLKKTDLFDRTRYDNLYYLYYYVVPTNNEKIQIKRSKFSFIDGCIQGWLSVCFYQERLYTCYSNIEKFCSIKFIKSSNFEKLRQYYNFEEDPCCYYSENCLDSEENIVSCIDSYEPPSYEFRDEESTDEEFEQDFADDDDVVI